MILYLDASVLIPLFIEEDRTDDAQSALPGHVLVVSDFALAEFSSGVGRRVRMGDLTANDGASAFATVDSWSSSVAQRETLATGDIAAALRFIRRLDLALRTPDAINIAIAERLGATLFTFDVKMAAAARAVGINVV